MFTESIARVLLSGTLLFAVSASVAMAQQGAYREIPATDEAGIEAATAAARAAAAKYNVQFVRLVKAQAQTVAGINYQLEMDVNPGNGVRRAQANVWRKLDKSYEVRTFSYTGR